MQNVRTAGILMPVFTLPSPHGIGCFSKEAFDFVDFLAESGQSLWQVLPLGPTGYGDSPYQSFSSCAGNPYFVDLEALKEKGLLTQEEISEYDRAISPETAGNVGRVNSVQGRIPQGHSALYTMPGIDYELIYLHRLPLLRKAYERSDFLDSKKYKKFFRKNSWWLEDYALFMAIKGTQGNQSFTKWEEKYRTKDPAALKEFKKENKAELNFYYFLQFYFYRQWKALKKYANSKGIRIIGDIPIYVSPDSSEAWLHPELFQFDDHGMPKAVAGCPPDEYSDTGQYWGNPLYDWDYHLETGFDWWKSRIKQCMKLYDIIRIDHFRGFEAYYSVPFGEPTAANGVWCKGPGAALFKAIRNAFGDRAEIIAEDLGFLTQGVHDLRDDCGLPGMKVLQFAFYEGDESSYLPYNYVRNSVVYTGTHDNDTTSAWAISLSPKERRYCMEFLNIPCPEAMPEVCDTETSQMICRAMVKGALSSPSNMAIIPIQDYLCMDGSARINLPSTIGGNWCFRLKASAMSPALAKDIRHLAELFWRLPKEESSSEAQDSADPQESSETVGV